MPTFNSRMSHLLKFIFIFCVIVAGAFYTGVRPPETLTIGPEGAEIEITNNDNTKTRSWKTRKVKDGRDDIENGFRLEQHCIGVDEDGDEETSCTVESEIFSGSVRAGPNGINQKPAYEALKKLISGSTICGEAGAPFYAKCVAMDNAVVAVVQTLTTQEKHKRKNGARTLVKRLEELGYLRTGIDDAGDAWVWLSDE